MKYQKGYKYQLIEDYQCDTDATPENHIRKGFISLTKTGHLRIKAGYAWDGASGMTIDTKNSMTPSLVHDALYYLMRHEKLPLTYRKKADALFYEMCRQRGMWLLRARLWLRGLKIADGTAALPENKKKTHTAP